MEKQKFPESNSSTSPRRADPSLCIMCKKLYCRPYKCRTCDRTFAARKLAYLGRHRCYYGISAKRLNSKCVSTDLETSTQGMGVSGDQENIDIEVNGQRQQSDTHMTNFKKRVVELKMSPVLLKWPKNMPR